MARLDQTGVPLLIARLFVGALFVYLAIDKIRDPVNFLKLTRQYKLVNEQSAYVLMNLIAVTLPWLEMLCGVVLILGVAVRAAGLLSAGMLVVFTPMILSRGLELYHLGVADTFCGVSFDCGCGSGVVFLCSKLLENSAMLLAAVLVVRGGRPRQNVRLPLQGGWRGGAIVGTEAPNGEHPLQELVHSND